MRATGLAIALALTGFGPAAAQNFVTSEQPTGMTTSISTSERVQRVYSVVPQPASTSEIEPVYTAPVYDAYEPVAFDAEGYDAAIEPMAGPAVPEPLPVERAYGEPVDVTPQDDLSQPLGSPQSFASIEPQASTGVIGFAPETETSRLLLALDDTYAARRAALKAKHLEQRKAMLDKFEADAADPQKVIGLAARMRAAIAELDAAHEALLAVEQNQYNAAVLTVLDSAPSRVE